MESLSKKLDFFDNQIVTEEIAVVTSKTTKRIYFLGFLLLVNVLGLFILSPSPSFKSIVVPVIPLLAITIVTAFFWGKRAVLILRGGTKLKGKAGRIDRVDNVVDKLKILMGGNEALYYTNLDSQDFGKNVSADRIINLSAKQILPLLIAMIPIMVTGGLMSWIVIIWILQFLGSIVGMVDNPTFSFGEVVSWGLFTLFWFGVYFLAHFVFAKGQKTHHVEAIYYQNGRAEKVKTKNMEEHECYQIIKKYQSID